MTRRRWRQTLDVQPDRVVAGGWRAGEFLRAAGLHPLWLASANGWVLDRHRAADAVAALERSPAALLITGEVVAPDQDAEDLVDHDAEDLDLQLDLFADGAA